MKQSCFSFWMSHQVTCAINTVINSTTITNNAPKRLMCTIIVIFCGQGLPKTVAMWHDFPLKIPAKTLLHIQHVQVFFSVFQHFEILHHYVHVIVHRNKFLFNKTNQMHKFPRFLFCQKTLHYSGISFAHHQEFSTVHSALVYFLQVRWLLPSRVRIQTLLGSGHQKAARNIPMPNVQ